MDILLHGIIIFGGHLPFLCVCAGLFLNSYFSPFFFFLQVGHEPEKNLFKIILFLMNGDNVSYKHVFITKKMITF